MIVDDRSGSKELVLIHPLDEISILSRLECEGCQHHPGERKAIGDVSIVGNGPDEKILSIGVEVKSVSDLLESEGNGRLQDQLKALIDHYDVCWLLTYGGYRSGWLNQLEVFRAGRWRKHHVGQRPVPYGYLEGALLTANVAGVSHKHVEDEQQAAAWLAVLERWWHKPWNKHRTFHAFNKSGNLSVVPNVDPQMLGRMSVAKELPGIGWEKALAAAVSFPTIRSMINATASEWERSVPGVGKVIAKAIERFVS